MECIQEQDRAGPAGRKNNEEHRKPENNEAGARTTRKSNEEQEQRERATRSKNNKRRKNNEEQSNIWTEHGSRTDGQEANATMMKTEQDSRTGNSTAEKALTVQELRARRFENERQQ